MSKSLTSAETHYSNIEREVLGMLHGPEISHHYCFACEVSMITDQEPLVAILRKVRQASHTGCKEYYYKNINTI